MSDEAMIAFLPANAPWCKLDLPHMTLVYAGPTADMQGTDLNELAKDAISAARLTRAFSLNVTGVETWGTDEKVDVLVLYPTPQLLLARELVKHWNKSEFADFKPHATVGPEGSAFAMQPIDNTNRYSYEDRNRSVLPSAIYFDRVAICWGDKRLIFNLGEFDY